jgi:hypothetical protein
MHNALIQAIAKNSNTFKECRLYLLQALGNKELLLKIESSNIETCIKYYISYLESKNLNINNIINYYHYEHPSLKYWDLLKTSVIGAFNKLEKGDTNFDVF